MTESLWLTTAALGRQRYLASESRLLSKPAGRPRGFWKGGEAEAVAQHRSLVR